jgi:flagellar biosynthetic protein FlhB
MSEDRSLPPSPRRREQAERRGFLPRSDDLGAAAVLAAAAVSVGLVGGGAMRFALRVVSEGLTGAAALEDPLQAAMASWGTALFVLAPFALLLALAAAAANLAQTGWRPRPDAILPDLSRVSPANGWRGIFGGGHRVAFGALKLAVVAALVVWTVWEGREGWLAAASEGAAALAGWAGWTVGALFARCVVALVFLGLLDHLALRARIERQIAVTPSEAAQEAREAEGDPALRRRRRALHAERAAGGRLREGAWILADRARIEVVLAGPSVVAVAGAGMARSLLRAARTRGTRVVDEPLLARALAGRVRPGGRVPAELEPRLREAFAA